MRRSVSSMQTCDPRSRYFSSVSSSTLVTPPCSTCGAGTFTRSTRSSATPGVAPLRQLPAGRLDDPVLHRDERAGLLGLGTNTSALSRPRCGCCHRSSASTPTIAPVREVELGLVVHAQLAGGEGAGQFEIELQPARAARRRLLRSRRWTRVAAVLARGRARTGRAPQQGVGVSAARSTSIETPTLAERLIAMPSTVTGSAISSRSRSTSRRAAPRRRGRCGSPGTARRRPGRPVRTVRPRTRCVRPGCAARCRRRGSRAPRWWRRAGRPRSRRRCAGRPGRRPSRPAPAARSRPSDMPSTDGMSEAASSTSAAAVERSVRSDEARTTSSAPRASPVAPRTAARSTTPSPGTPTRTVSPAAVRRPNGARSLPAHGPRPRRPAARGAIAPPGSSPLIGT